MQSFDYQDPVARMDHLTDLHPYDTGKYAGVQVTLKSRDNCHVNSQVACHNGKSADQQDREQAYVESIVARLNAKKTMADISIPGCRTIFGRNAHMVRRIVWCLILVACTLVCTFQVKDRVDYYLKEPVAVNVRVSRNDSLRFPMLTLCNKNLFNVTAINILKRMKADQLQMDSNVTVTQEKMNGWPVAELIGTGDVTDANKLWDFIAHHIDTMIVECWFGRNVMCNQTGQWKKVYTYMGVCYSYQLDYPNVTTTGMFNNLYLRMNDTKDIYMNDAGWKMLIHDQTDSPTIEVRTHGTTLYRQWAKDVRIYVRAFATIQTKNRPCNADEKYSYSKCIAECYNEDVMKVVNCTLPFMKGSKPSCNTPKSYTDSVYMADQLLFYGLWSSNNCTKCIKQCKQDIYIPYTETTQMKPADDKLGKLRIYYQDLTFDDIEEELAYTPVPLLCDIGGSLGLLLGASVLTFFEIIEALTAAVVTYCHRLSNPQYNARPTYQN